MTDRELSHPSAVAPQLRVHTSAGWIATAWPQVVVSLAGVAATLWAVSLLWRRIDGLAVPAYDLAFFQQVVWNIGTTGAWVSSFNEGSFLGLHFSPILIVPAVLERLTGWDVHLLSLLHAIGLGALGPAAFLFLRAALRPSRFAGPLAAALSVGIPVWAAMQWVLRSDFHPELYGVVFAFLAGWAGLTGRPRAMWVLAVLAMVTREDVAYAVVVMGIVVAVRGRGPMRRHGRALVVVAIAWACIVFGLVMPWLRDGASSDTDRYYRWLGQGPAVLLAPFTMFDRIVAALTRDGPWFVVAGMLIALVGLPLLRPRWLLLVGPPLIALLLSGHPAQAAVLLQYPLILLVPLVAAAAMGARRALAMVGRAQRRRGRRRDPGPAPVPRAEARRGAPLVPIVFVLIAVIASAGAWVQGSMPPFDDRDAAFAARAPAVRELRAIATRVPVGAPMVADEGLVALLSGRPAIDRLTAIGYPSREAFVLVDRAAWSPTASATTRREFILAMFPTSGRTIIADDGRFVLWGPAPAAVAP